MNRLGVNYLLDGDNEANPLKTEAWRELQDERARLRAWANVGVAFCVVCALFGAYGMYKVSSLPLCAPRDVESRLMVLKGELP